MARKARKKQGTVRLKKKVASPKTTRTTTVRKSVAKKKVAKKSKPTRRRQEMSSREWLNDFFSSLVTVQLQEFFRWCWENIDKKQTREVVAALYREIFFPFESMPEHKRLPIWRRTKVVRFVHSLTSAKATTLEEITQQWAEETGRNIDSVRPGKG